MQVVIENPDPKHERPNDYEPAEPTAEELKLCGVTLVGSDDFSIALTCDVCGKWWMPLRPERRDAYWICPNARSSK